MTVDDDLWDDLFHGCAWAAYLEVWQQTGQFPPDSETTRRLAYQLYEEALAAKNGPCHASAAMGRRSQGKRLNEPAN